MDSGNSGSISSSGDEEYESRGDHHSQSIPSFLSPSLTHFGSSDPNPQTSDHSQLLSHHHHSLFDPSPSSSNYLQPTSNPNTNFFLNLDTRSALMRSDHNQQQQQQQQTYHLGLINNNNNNPTVSASAVSSIPNQQSLVQGSHHNHHHHHQFPGPSTIQPQQPSTRSGGSPGVARSSKKRTRASRRAPTTVLTTDTSNFRAMVQEFTGIPAPPFSAASPFSRRFDLFGTGSSGIRSSLDAPLYPNLVRPSAIKPPQTTPFGGGHVATAAASSSLFGNVMDIAASSVNYSQPSDQHQGLMISKQPMMRSMLGMQNQGLNMAFHVQSLPNLHPNSLNVASGFGGAKQAQPNLALDHLNVGHGYGVGADQGGTAQVAVSDANQNQNVWRAEGSADMSCKMNYTAAAAVTNSSEFNGDKGGLEINVSTRGEGTVDSWIFPSD